MIRIHTGVLPAEQLACESLVVREPAHYPIVRRHIHEALVQEEDLEVFVVTRVCDGWFWDLYDYHSDVVHIDDTPTERLKRKLSIHNLPADLTTEPNLIVELGLLDLADPTKPVSDVWKWIIRNRMGSVWAVEQPSREHFSELVGWYLENTVDPVLQSRVERIEQAWIDAASGRLPGAYARFFENPHKNAFSLLACKALAAYDRQIREQWLAPEGWFSPRIDDLIEFIEMPLRLPEAIRRKLNSRLQTHWNTRLKERFDD